jgi:hypothetical protein
MSNIEELKNEVELCERTLGDALVDADQSTIAKASKSLDAARQALTYAELEVVAKQRREAAAKDGIKAEVTAERRGRVAALAEQRVDAARRVEKHAAQLGEAIEALIVASREIGIASPDKLSEETALSHDRAIAGHVIEALQRAKVLVGIKQPIPLSPWDLQQRVALSDRVMQANQYLASFNQGV